MNQPELEERTERRLCKRGCTQARHHLPTCENQDTCRGCLPRDAEFGFLCYGCNSRLTDNLKNAAYQMDLLALMAGLKGQHEMTAQTQAKISTSWRTDDSQVISNLYAKGSAAAVNASEPYRVAVLDSEREITDRIALWVVHLTNDYNARAPEADTVICNAAWLLRHIEWLVWREAIGDELEQFGTIMATAHSLAPWREAVVRLRGIPCPECQATTLVLKEAESDVTCLRCSATMSHERYGIWTRILADEQRKAVS